MKNPEKACPELVFLDFGGVIAQEGFKAAMVDLALGAGKDPEGVKRTAFDLVYATGFTLGRIREDTFWQAFREATGIGGEDAFLTDFVKARFVLRPSMLALASRLREKGIRTAILSDQTHWLKEMDAKEGFFCYFDRVFNSYDAGMTKKEPAFFIQVLETMKTPAHKALFVDDHKPHVDRALALGMDALWYQEEDVFQREMQARFPFALFTP